MTVFNPVGWRLVVKPPQAGRRVGSIYLPDISMDAQTALANKGQVVAIGPDAFRGRQFLTYERDGSAHLGEPWVKVGDWVTFNRHSVLRFKTKENEEEVLYLVINDTDILTTIPAPDVVETYVFTAFAEE